MRVAFFFNIVVTILKQLLFLVTWKYFFVKYKMVSGWNFDHMLLMYGTVCFAMGFVESFFYGLKELPRIIETGQLDTFILQPKNMVLNIAMSKGDMSSLGEVVAGIMLIAYSGFLANEFLAIVLILAITVLFMFALLLYLSCIAFFVQNSFDFIRELNLNSIIVATQPNSAYQGAFKMLTFTLLPVAFLSYFPIEYIRTDLSWYLWVTLIGTGIFFAVACGLFKLGLKRYESGNMINYRT